MDRKIEGKWEGLMAALVLARSDERSKDFVQYGERIVDLVEQGDYEEARFTASCLGTAISSFWKGDLTRYMNNYIEKTKDLVDSLP